MATQVKQGEIVVTGQRYPKITYVFIPSDRDSTPAPRKDGVLGTTPFRTSPDFRAQIAWDAVPSEARVIGFAHSHPALQLESSGAETTYWTDLDEAYLLRPSPNQIHGGTIIGDWVT